MTQRVTQDDIMDILQAFGHSGFAQLELTLGSVRIAVNRASAAAVCSVDLLPGTTQIVAPLLGMFQAGPEPGAPAFVKPGTKVETDTTVGIIRVMQNLTVVKAGLCGTVVDVQVQDGQFVEFGQTLLRVSTESAAQGSDRPESDRANAP
jgi:biotin carboxyl carrier protein